MITLKPPPPLWQEIPAPSAYSSAVALMQDHAVNVAREEARETIFLTEHTSVYTAGTSAKPEELLNSGEIETYRTGRGGQWTYHGPGQQIIWPVLNLNQRNRDIRAYIHSLEAWMIDVLACFAVNGERRCGLPGIWVRRGDINKPDQMDKIVAVGIRLARWVSQHGLAINLEPDLSHFSGIVPCGITDGGVTSLADLGLIVSSAELQMAIKDCFTAHFGAGTVMGLKG